MSGTTQLLDCIEIDIGNLDNLKTIYIEVSDNSLSRKWLTALNDLIKNNYHLEKNYCFFGFPDSDRNGLYMCKQINNSIAEINNAKLGYVIDDIFTVENTIIPGEITGRNGEGGDVNHNKLNHLHRYFEDLQGVSGRISPYYNRADNATRWHIRQLNLLCHEFESWALSVKKKHTAPDWVRPSQLMCWLQAPRFILDEEDYELFGIDTINRPLGGVFVGVNKAVGKHHYEVFQDEGRDSRIDELTTTTLRSQTEAAGDFDIEWGQNPAGAPWQTKNLTNFRIWLINNGFDPEDKSLTIGHPQVGQVDLIRSFGTEDYREIWAELNTRLNVAAIRTSSAQATYNYHWDDPDYMEKQIECLG
jgi:hypothetical protein